MKPIYIPLLLAITTGLFMACSLENTSAHSKTVTDSSFESLLDQTQAQTDEWVGTYQAVVPCKDCDNLLIELTLNQDSSYYLSEKYINNDQNHQPLDAIGIYRKDPTNSQLLILDGAGDNRRIMVYKGGITLSSRSTEHKFTLLKTS